MNMRIAITIALLSLTSALFAQSRQVSGNITANEDGEPLIGVNVIVKGTSTGTVSDIDGNYTLNAAATDTLVYSYTGFVSQEIVVGGQSNINLKLFSDTELLEEVVVIGYGVQKKKVATGSISKLTTDNLEGYQVQNVQSALEGQVSGLIVSESSGQPGSGKAILIRGISTNGDNSPLFIVDGLQVSGIDNINPNDIESVDVLKDAASCAIYGARAANGVVIITTKKGTGVGEVVYEVFTSRSNPWKLPTMLEADDYVALTREKFENGNQTGSLNDLGFPQIGESSVNTDWMDVIFNESDLTSHRLSASANNMFLSLEYWDENGVVGGDKSNYKRYSARVNGNKEITDWLKVGENVYINRVENANIGINSAFGTLISDAFAYDPITEVYDESAQYGFAQSPWVQKEYINPLSRLFVNEGSGHGDQVLGNVYAEFKPIEQVKFHSDLGMDYGWYKFRSFTPDFAFHPSFTNVSNDIVQGYGFGQSFQVENYVNYTDSLNSHHYDFLLGTSYRRSTFEQAGGSSSFIPQEVQFQDNFQILDAGQDTIDLAYGGIGVEYRSISYYGRLLYDYDDKYLFSATLRRDGSSNFGAANRFGVFPSFSVGWVISDESFFAFDRVNFAKIRASWGINGNDRISPLSFASRVENVFTYPLGTEQSLNNGSALATPPNPNVKWEESEQLDIGLELRFFDDKLTAEIDYYRKNTKDLLMAQQIPGFIGATNNPISNLGEIQNTGIEASIHYKFNVGDVKIQTGLNYTTFENEVINVAGDLGYLEGWGWPVRNQAITRMSEGFPVGHFVGYQTAGIFQGQEEVFSHINANGDLLQPNASAGDIRFIDTNGDGVINTDDIGHLGSPWPDHIIGITLSAQYLGFDFNMILGSQMGHDIFRTYERSDITFTNYQDFWLDRWTPDNPSTTLPRLTSTDPNGNQRPSDFYIEDGSFWRLRNLQVGYNLPKRMLSKIHVKGVRVYFSANNLLTLTDYRGFDPEIGTTGWILDTGIDKGFYPANKSLGVGLKITL